MAKPHPKATGVQNVANLLYICRTSTFPCRATEAKGKTEKSKGIIRVECCAHGARTHTHKWCFPYINFYPGYGRDRVDMNVELR